VLVSGAVLLLSLPVLVGGLIMLYLDRHYGGDLFHGFTGSRGGNPLLWPRLFWFAAYPLLWALLLPALGTVSEILQTFAGRPLVSRARALPALGAVGVLAFAGWGSEVSNLPRARPLFAVGALAILAPVASLVLNWLLTLRAAGSEGDRDVLRRRFLEPPMLWALGFLPVLALGLAGAAVSAVDAGRRSHRNYWQVAEQHSLFFGAATIGALAALAYWGPKLWGRRMSTALGRLEVLAVVGGTLLTVLAFFALGIEDMAAHLPTYTSDDGWGPANLAATVGAVIVVLGLLLFLIDLMGSVLARRGSRPGPDPWGGHTLEWVTTSPPPIHNFEALPEIRSETPLLDLRAAAEPAAAPAPQEAG
jgi:heme/copper-type cytochrome/quinol oxidase subunit 1